MIHPLTLSQRVDMQNFKIHFSLFFKEYFFGSFTGLSSPPPEFPLSSIRALVRLLSND